MSQTVNHLTKWKVEKAPSPFLKCRIKEFNGVFVIQILVRKRSVLFWKNPSHKWVNHKHKPIFYGLEAAKDELKRISNIIYHYPPLYPPANLE